ncbi:MAG: DUF2723 domain-containing protein [Methanotrichaceae archaeon]|nr:DUF2723 domain-containing protein [Methanotrichaceae archaeon]
MEYQTGQLYRQSPIMLDLIVGFLLFLSTFIVYLKHLAPSVFIGDSAEVTIASYVLGIPHPPGFPVYTWFGHIFTFIPIGDIAYRVNFMSAFFGALVIPVVYMIIRSLAPQSQGSAADITSLVGSIIGSMSFAFSIFYWGLAEVAEVYTLNSFFIASMILLALIWTEKRDARLLYLLSLLFALSLGIYAINILFAPFFLVFLFLVDRKALLNKKTLFLMITILFTIGALQLLYLFVRAWQGPLYAYADIRTLDSFLYFITARGATQPFSMPLSSGISMYKDFLAKSFSLIGIVIGIIGIVLSLRRDALKSAFLASMFVINILFNVQFNTFDVYDRLIPSFMIFSIFIGLGIWEVLDLIETSSERIPALDGGKKGPFLKIFLIVLVMIIAASVPISSYNSNSQIVDRSISIDISYFLAQILSDIPANSTIFDIWQTCVPLRYFQIIYHINPNVEIRCEYPALWPNDIQERINKRDVFLLRKALIDKTLFNKYSVIPVLNMPGVGVLSKVNLGTPSFSVSNPVIQHPVNELAGEGKIKLLGYDLNQTEEKGGFSITYYWQSMENVSKDYISAIDLIDLHGNVVSEDVHLPIYDIYPTSRWAKNEVFAERYNISLAATIEPGTYQMYMTGTWNNDESAPYDKILLGNIKVGKIDPKDALMHLV